MYVEYSLQNRFVFFISLFGLSAILKIRNGEHVHYVGLVVAYTWNREKQMFVALGKEFDMVSAYLCKVGVETVVWKEFKITSLNSASNYHENQFFHKDQEHFIYRKFH